MGIKIRRADENGNIVDVSEEESKQIDINIRIKKYRKRLKILNGIQIALWCALGLSIIAQILIAIF